MKKRYVILLDIGLVAVGLAAGGVTKWMLELLPDCPIATMGLLCPACGGTRCVRYFFGGQLAEAFRVNPFFFLLIWYLATALVLLNAGVLLGIKKAERIAVRMTDWRAVIAAALLFFIFGVARNFW